MRARGGARANGAEQQLLVFDLEPKLLLEGEGDWRNLNFTQGYEHAAARWVDLIGECLVGYTNDTLARDATEVTPRLGAAGINLRVRWDI